MHQLHIQHSTALPPHYAISQQLNEDKEVLGTCVRLHGYLMFTYLQLFPLSNSHYSLLVTVNSDYQ